MVTRDEATSPRQRILNVTLSLMAQKGVDGTSMRDLAAAAGLNVASLYHYFPSKQDLLVAVLAQRGMVEQLRSSSPVVNPEGRIDALTQLLDEILGSMLDVEDFIRLMLGEVMRGDETVRSVGADLYAATQEALERWLEECQPELVRDGRATAWARALRAFLIGVFFEHVAGVLDDDGDTRQAFHARAREMAQALDTGDREANPGLKQSTGPTGRPA